MSLTFGLTLLKLMFGLTLLELMVLFLRDQFVLKIT